MKPGSTNIGKGIKLDKDSLDKILATCKGASRDDLTQLGIEVDIDEWESAQERLSLRRFLLDNLKLAKEKKLQRGEKYAVATETWKAGDSFRDIDLSSSEVKSMGVDDLRMIPGLTMQKKVYGTTKGRDTEELKGIKFLTIIDGCLAGDSLILMEDGSLKPIREVREGERVLVSGEKKNFSRKVLKKWNLGKRSILKITTTDGYELKATPNHKVFAYLKGQKHIQEVAISELNIEDKLLTQRTWKTISKDPKLSSLETFYTCHSRRLKPLVLDENLGYILGSLCGDGHYSFSPRSSSAYFAITDKDKSNLEFIQRKAIEVFGFEPLIRNRQRQRLYFNHRPLTRYLKNIFPTILIRSREREIPAIIQKCSKKVLAGFLRGLFDAEGYISDHSIDLTTSSERLSFQLLLLLSRFGIKAQRYKFVGTGGFGKGNSYWKVCINGSENIQLFRELIGFMAKKKQAKACMIGGSLQPRHYSSRLVTHKIKTLEAIGEEEVYDLTIQGLHCYYANGLKVHNSGSMFTSDDKSGTRGKVGKALLIGHEIYAFTKKLGFDYNLALFSDRGIRVPTKQLKAFWTDATERASYGIWSGGTSLSKGLKEFSDEEYKDANVVIVSDMDLGDVSESKNHIVQLTKLTNSFKIILIEDDGADLEERERSVRDLFPSEINLKVMVFPISTLKGMERKLMKEER